ncbi:hypothetical protein [Thermococcus sp.]|uniref:hypothetical protein n=1 Tax=Thermococcus sp. TaxID=35749 RepID=UPI003459AD6E
MVIYSVSQRLRLMTLGTKVAELDTIVFVTPSEEWKTILDLRRGAFLIEMRSDSVLKELLNAKAPFERANLEPQIILLRVPKEAEKLQR